MPLTQLAPNQRLRGTGELSWCAKWFNDATRLVQSPIQRIYGTDYVDIRDCGNVTRGCIA